MESVPEDTLEYVQDEKVVQDKDNADNNAVEEEVDILGEWYGEKREESFNFEKEMETVRRRLE